MNNPADATVAEIQTGLDEIEAAVKRLNESFSQSREYKALTDGIVAACEDRGQLDPAAVQRFFRLIETYKSIGGLMSKSPFAGGGAKEMRKKVARAILIRRWPKFLGTVHFHD
jgi:hypothetical protein